MTSTAGSQHRRPQRTRLACCSQLIFWPSAAQRASATQPPNSLDILGRRAHKASRCAGKKSTLLRVFLTSMLRAFRDALFQDTLTTSGSTTQAQKNGPLCLAAKLLTCSAALADNDCDAGRAQLPRERPAACATSGMLCSSPDARARVRLKLKINRCGFPLSIIDEIDRKLCDWGGGVGRFHTRLNQWASLTNACSLVWKRYACLYLKSCWIYKQITKNALSQGAVFDFVKGSLVALHKWNVRSVPGGFQVNFVLFTCTEKKCRNLFSFNPFRMLSSRNFKAAISPSPFSSFLLNMPWNESSEG